jgi:hypothetical protein
VFHLPPAFGIGTTLATSTIAAVPYVGSRRWSRCRPHRRFDPDHLVAIDGFARSSKSR